MLDKINGVLGVNSLELADRNDLTFWNGKKPLKTKSEYIIIHEDYEDFISKPPNFLIPSKNPKLDFIKYAWKYHPPRGNVGLVFKASNIKIGRSCSIGYDGFGYERDEYGKLWKFPHYGGVLIFDNVEIGSNTCIDRGTFDDTYIGEGTKIDNLVHIAHNVHIGKNCIIVAGTVIGGGAIIGDSVWLGINSSIREGITIGDGAMVGMGAVVVKDVEPYTTVIGNPARVYEK